MTRSNTQLQQDVLEELEYEPSVNAPEIGIAARDGIVEPTSIPWRAKSILVDRP